MMRAKSNMPQIRFKGFSEEWKEKTLDDAIIDLYNGQTPSRIVNEFWNGNINWLSSGELNRSVVTKTIEKISVSGQKSANLRIVPRGTFVMAITGLEATGTRGNCAILGIDTTLNQSCMAIYPNPNLLHTHFLFQWYRKHGEEYGIKFTQGTKQQSYNAAIIRKLDITLPKVAEQTKIGNYFQNLDKLIEQKEQKYQKLRQFKTAMLSKMFPQNGATIPEIRFKGFSGEWEEKELDEVVNRYDNLRVPISAINRIAGDTPYYGANGIQDYVKGHTHDGEFILVAEDGANDLKNYPVQYVNGKIWVNNHAHVLQAKKNVADNSFLKFAISKINIEPFLVGGGRAKLNANIMMKINFYLPSDIDEQTKIGNYFQKIDTLIDLHAQELDKLRHIKKASLEKMFV